MKPVFVFDFDGVIVDSLGALYRVYTEFLEGFGHRGSPGEFDELNGPKLPEIITLLKARHSLPGSADSLLALYREKVSSLYHGACLVPGVKGVLDGIRRAGFPLALASSSSKQEIIAVLERFHLASHFDFIITGDQVERAKPDPEIYRRVGAHFPGCQCHVVEDSVHGLAAAQGAGMATIHYAPASPQAHGTARGHSRVATMAQLGDRVLEIMVGCTCLARFPGPVDICLEGGPGVAFIKAPIEERVNRIWERALGQAKRFDGRVLSYVSHGQGGSKIICREVDYKYFFAQLAAPELGLDIHPLAVSGMILDKNGKTLVGKRSRVSQYPGRWELVPSGGMDVNSDSQNRVEDQLAREFEEETGWAGDRIHKILPICLILNGNHGNYDVGALIRLDSPLERLPLANEEYQDFKIMDVAEIRDTGDLGAWVPTSLILAATVLAMDLI